MARVDMSESAIAAYNRRRQNGDFGTLPSQPSVGIRMDSAKSTAIIAAKSQLGPKLWYPSKSNEAQRASTLASRHSNDLIPGNPTPDLSTPDRRSLAAAKGASSLTGEDLGYKYAEDAYNWNRKHGNSSWAHEAASASLTAAKTDEKEIDRGVDSLTKPPADLTIDISKVLGAAQEAANKRLAEAQNHLPANFGQMTKEERYQRRQEVLSLISIADRNVKARMASVDKDLASRDIYGSADFQRIAFDIASGKSSRRMANHGKIDLGGGLYMNPDEVDDIARRHVQPVLEKVSLVAEKKRIADEEERLRAEEAKRAAAEAKEAQRRQKESDKAAAQAEKQRIAERTAAAKAKEKRAAERAKENAPKGSVKWHWHNVEALKDDVKEAKQTRLDLDESVEKAKAEHASAEKQLAAEVAKHHDLKKDYFERGEVLNEKTKDLDEDATETASVFQLKQQRERVKLTTKDQKSKRQQIEEYVESCKARLENAISSQEAAVSRHRELKQKYFDAKAAAEEAQEKYNKEEQERLAREAEEKAKREAEEAERKKKEEEARKKREAEEAARKQKEAEAKAKAKREEAERKAKAKQDEADRKTKAKADKEKAKKEEAERKAKAEKAAAAKKAKDAKEAKEAKEAAAAKKAETAKAALEAKQAKQAKEAKEAKQAKDVKEVKEVKAAKSDKKEKAVEEPKVTKDVSEPEAPAVDEKLPAVSAKDVEPKANVGEVSAASKSSEKVAGLPAGETGPAVVPQPETKAVTPKEVVEDAKESAKADTEGVAADVTTGFDEKYLDSTDPTKVADKLKNAYPVPESQPEAVESLDEPVLISKHEVPEPEEIKDPRFEGFDSSNVQEPVKESMFTEDIEDAK